MSVRQASLLPELSGIPESPSADLPSTLVHQASLQPSSVPTTSSTAAPISSTTPSSATPCEVGTGPLAIVVLKSQRSVAGQESTIGFAYISLTDL